MPAVILAAFVAAEGIAASGAVPAAAAVHAVIVVAALNAFLFADDDRSPAVFAVLGLLSAMRLVTMTLPVGTTSIALRAVAVGAPVLLAAAVLARQAGFAGREPAGSSVSRRARVAVQVGVAVAGIPLGIAAAAAQHASRPHFADPVVGYLLTGAAVALFAGATEEIVFRRLLIPAARKRFGGGVAVVGSTVAFVATYLGAHSLGLLAVAAAAGLLFGWAMERTGSAVGPVLGHALATVGALLVWPGVLPR